MPIYTWECQDCGHVTEVLVKVQDRDEKVKCEECESERTQRCYDVSNFTIYGYSYANGYAGEREKKD